MQRIIVTMSDELVAVIDQYALAEERSRSSVVRRALQTVFQPELFRPLVITAPKGHVVEHVANPTVSVMTGAAMDKLVAGSHPFKAQPGNALRCAACGGRKGTH